MQSFLVHANCLKKFFFFIQYKKGKMLRRASLKDNISQTTKETKAKFNDLIFRENFSTKNKPSNYSIPFSSWLDTKCSFTESMNTFFLIQRMDTPF